MIIQRIPISMMHDTAFRQCPIRLLPCQHGSQLPFIWFRNLYPCTFGPSVRANRDRSNGLAIVGCIAFFENIWSNCLNAMQSSVPGLVSFFESGRAWVSRCFNSVAFYRAIFTPLIKCFERFTADLTAFIHTLIIAKRWRWNNVFLYIKMIEHRLAHWHKAAPPPTAKDSADMPLFMEIGS